MREMRPNEGQGAVDRDRLARVRLCARRLLRAVRLEVRSLWFVVTMAATALLASFTLGVWCGMRWGSDEIDRGYTRLIEKVVERVKDR